MRNFFVLTVLLVCTSFFAASAQNYQVHSVYLYSFMKYIKWPDALEDSPFKLGVMGESEVTPFLEQLAASRKSGNRAIELTSMGSFDLTEISSLDMLFIPAGNMQVPEFEKILQLAKQENVVIVTDEDVFPEGGHINFIEESGKLFFELDRQSLEQSGVRIASELMALARTAE